jgi:nanoRNase/pAp phosphatase (c-di-AMP/oligoRNAs hydrolase)
MNKTYRLVTRADFDGLVCAALLKEMALIEEIVFVHPKDMADGKVAITPNDITTNLPYNEAAYLAFDHHASETIRLGSRTPPNLVLDPEADSTAHVVYRYYGGRERFPRIGPDLMAAVDKADAARFTEEEILNPGGWVLLNFIMDPRTGLGRFAEFSNPNLELMRKLIDYCREHSIDEILELPDVLERVKLYFEHAEQARLQMRRLARVHGALVVMDYREEKLIHPCNRFVVYALYPKCNISLHVHWGVKSENTVFAMGHSILNRTSAINVGELMLSYRGGGHVSAGTCQVANDDAERVLGELIEHVRDSEESTVETVVDDADPGEAARTAGFAVPHHRAPGGHAAAAGGDAMDEIRRRLDRLERIVSDMASVPVRR